MFFPLQVWTWVCAFIDLDTQVRLGLTRIQLIYLGAVFGGWGLVAIVVQ